MDYWMGKGLWGNLHRRVGPRSLLLSVLPWAPHWFLCLPYPIPAGGGTTLQCDTWVQVFLPWHNTAAAVINITWCGPYHLGSKSNQIKWLLLSHHHSTSALVSEILMSVLQTVQKNNRQFTYGQTVQKKQQTIYIWTDSAKKQQTIYIWTDSAKNCTGAFTVLQTVQKNNNNSNLHMDRQCKKSNSNLHMDSTYYRLYRRQCAKYTYIYSVHIVYYKDILNYQRHIIHRMGTSALCTVSIHNVVYA